MPRYLRILFRPEATWREIRAQDPSWRRSVFGHALPLSLLPGFGWAAAKALEGEVTGATAFTAIAVTALVTLASVLSLAAGFVLLAGFFRSSRHWSRAVALASYAATPVLLFGVLLVYPLAMIGSIGAVLYGIGLCAAGVPIMLDTRASDVAGYIVGAAVFTAIASTAAGALCSAIGVL